MSQVRDLPPISGAIIWAKQIERQLRTYMQRIEAVLGRDWQQHVEGKQLKSIRSFLEQQKDIELIWCKRSRSRRPPATRPAF